MNLEHGKFNMTLVQSADALLSLQKSTKKFMVKLVRNRDIFKTMKVVKK